jgi:ABC-type enterobactin transport system permease subunit
LHVRAFYVTALAGGVICIIALAAPSTLHNLAYFAGVMAAIMWLSAAYLLRNADRIAAKALNQNWSV